MAGLDGLKLLGLLHGLLHNGLLDATGRNLCENRATRRFEGGALGAFGNWVR